jgi:cytochrome c-type biogenesis protein CcmE
MRSGTIKVLLTIAIAFGGVAFLAFQSIGDVEYYEHVDKIVENPEPWTKRKTIQIHGFARAVPRKAELEGQKATRRFEITQNGKTISVYHEGPVPDTFKEEAETVVKGSLSRNPDGTLLLTTVGGEQGIMAKCPSKYEGKK